MNQLISVVKSVRLTEPIYKTRLGFEDTSFLWLEPGVYKVVREFDEERYLIETDNGLTLVRKALTESVS